MRAVALLVVVIQAWPVWAQDAGASSCRFWLSTPRNAEAARQFAVDIWANETARVPLHGVGWSVSPTEVAENVIANCAARPGWSLRQAVVQYMRVIWSQGR